MVHQGLMGHRFSGTAAMELDVSVYCEKDNTELAPVVLFDPQNTGTGQGPCRRDESIFEASFTTGRCSDVLYRQSVQ